jgi:hypothetical protein
LLVLAALAGTLVWFADQPTVDLEHICPHDRLVLVLSRLVTSLFCHFALFTFQKVRQRLPPD